MQTVSYAGSSYNIPNTRGDRPWSGLSDFIVAAAAKSINTAGGNFTLLADINFGATFGLVSTYYKSRTANVASAGQLRLANTDTIKWRNGLNDGDLTLDINSNNLRFASTKILLSGAVVNADINASAAIAYSKLALTGSIVNADLVAGTLTNTAINASAAIALSKLAAVTASRVLVSDSSGNVSASSVTSTTLAFLDATSSIQTQLNGKASSSGTLLTTTDQTASGVKTFSGQLIGKGTATNDNAAAGYIGEYIEGTVTSNTNYFGNGTYGELTSLTLTAGDWDVTGMMDSQANGSTVTGYDLFIGTAVGNNQTGQILGVNGYRAIGSTSVEVGIAIPVYRLSIAAGATYYLKGAASYGSGTAQYRGARISARRVR
jgi:hypothetical protein